MKTNYDQSDVGRNAGWLHPLFKPLLTILFIFLLSAGIKASPVISITGNSFCWDGVTNTNIGCSGAVPNTWFVLYHFSDDGTWQREAFFLNNAGTNGFVFVQDYGDGVGENGLFVVYSYTWAQYNTMMADQYNPNLITSGTRVGGEIWIWKSPADETLQFYGTQDVDYTLSSGTGVYCSGTAGVSLATTEASQFTQWMSYGVGSNAIISVDQWVVKYVIFDGTTRIDSADGTGSMINFQPLTAGPNSYTAKAYRGDCAALDMGETVTINDQARVKNVTKALCYLTITEALAGASANNTLYLLKDEAYPEDVNITLNGITIMSDPAFDPPSGSGHFLCDIQGQVSIAADNVTLQDLDGIYTSTSGQAIIIGNGSNYTIDSIYWIQGLTYGMLVTSNVGGGTVKNSTFTSNPIGIQTNGTINGVFTLYNNTIEGPNPASGAMIGIKNAAANVVVNQCGNFNFYLTGIENSGAGLTVHHSNFTNIDSTGTGVNNTASGVLLYNNDFSYYPKDSIVIAIDATIATDARSNWYGRETGPTVVGITICGSGSQIIGGSFVQFWPWFFEQAMTSKNGLPPVTVSDIPNTSTITKTPIIMSASTGYINELSDYNSRVKADARITSNSGTFPANAVVTKILINSIPFFTGSYSVAGETTVYMSDILGSAPSLASQNGSTFTWDVYLEGFNKPWSSNLTLDAVSYIDDKTACNNILGSDDFTLAFANSTLSIDSTSGSNKNVVCTGVDPLKFDVVITYPTIQNVDSDIKADAKITSDIDIPMGTEIKWSYNGSVQTSYLVAADTKILYLHDIVGVVQQPLQGNSGTDTWSFEIPSDYDPLINTVHNLTIDAIAVLDGNEYVHASKSTSLTVHPLPTADISVATGYSNHICANADAHLSVHLTGTGPWDYVLTPRGGTPENFHQVSADTTFTRAHTANTTWIVSPVNDIYCSNTQADSVRIYIGTITYVGTPFTAPYCEGDTVHIPITVQGFEDVGVLSLTLNYDKTALQYIDFTKKYLAMPFNVDGDSAGVIKMGGYGSVAYQMPDNDTLFVLNFVSKGKTTLVAWENDNPASCEYVSFETGLPFCDVPNSYYYRDLQAPGLVQHSRPKAAMSGTDNICDGSTGHVSVVLTGEPKWKLVYSINPGTKDSVAEISGTSPKTYSLAVSPTGVGTYTYAPIGVIDESGCSAWAVDLSGSGSVSVEMQPVIDNSVKSDISCYSTQDGSISLTVTPASGVSYTWTGPSGFTANTQDISNLAKGTYEVTASNGTGFCKDTGSWTITQPDTLKATVTKTDAVCYADANAKISITNPTGGQSGIGQGYNFRWVNGASSSSWTPYVSSPLEFTGLVAGTYSVEMQDNMAPSCTRGVGSVTLNQLSALTATLDQDSAKCFGATSGKVIITNPGGGVYPSDSAQPVYQFQLKVGSTVLYSWTKYSYVAGKLEFSGCNANTYTVEMRRVYYSSCATAVGNVTVLGPNILGATTTPTKTTCYGASDGYITITNPTGGTGTKWFKLKNFDNTVTIQDYTVYTSSPAFTFSNLAAGIYHVWEKDAHDCEKDLGTTSVNQPDQLNASHSHTDVTCYGESTGVVTITSASGGVTGNGQDLRLMQGVTEVATWQQFVAPSISFTGLAAGTYTVEIRDHGVNTCTRSLGDETVSEPGQLNASFDSVAVSCYGLSDGKVRVTNPTGGLTGAGSGYEFKLTQGVTTVQDWTGYVAPKLEFSGLSAGTYTVYVRDKLNTSCERNLGTQEVTQAVDMSATVDTTGATCYSVANGNLRISAVTGGNVLPDPAPSYQVHIEGATVAYNWASYTAPFTDYGSLAAGTWTVKIRNASTLCEKTIGDFVITEPNQLTATTGHSNVTCYNGSDGSIDVTSPSGGIKNQPGSGYEFKLMKGVTQIQGWTAYAAPFSFSNLAEGTYDIFMRDKLATICYRNIGSETITQPDVLSATVTPDSTTCNGSSDGKITVTSPSGGNIPYAWNFKLMKGATMIQDYTSYSIPAAKLEFTNLAAGTDYHVWIQDANATGCTKDLGAVTVLEPNPIPLTGYLNYYNTNNTLLKKFKVYLYEGGNQVNMTTSDLTGMYTFATVCPGTYEIRVGADSVLLYNPVNETDASLVSNYSLPPLFQKSKYVKFYAGDVVMNNRLSGGDAGQIESYFMTSTIAGWLGRPNWTFWFPADSISANPGVNDYTLRYPTLTVTKGSAPISKNLLGLFTGDFNGSWVGNAKSTGNLSINTTKTLMVEPGVEFELPVLTTSPMEVGAISMIMNFPADKLEIMGAYLKNNPDENVKVNLIGNELRIGWFGNSPINLNTGERLLTLRLKLISNLEKGETIALTLKSLPTNELADGDANVIPNVVLTIDNIAAATIGMGDLTANNLGFANYPNPFNESTTFVYSLPFSGTVNIELFDMVGKKIQSYINESMTSGEHTFVVNSGDIKPGVYTATLTLKSDEQVVKRTIKIIRNR